VIAPGVATRSQDAERDRIVAAMVDLVANEGYEHITLAMVIARAGVEEDAFHRHFVDIEDCFCQILQEMNEDLVRRAAALYERETGWRNQLRASAYEVLDFLLEDPRRARFMLVDMLSLGDRAQLIRDQAMSFFSDFLDEGRKELDDPDSVSRATAEGITGAVYHRLHMGVVQDEMDDLMKLVPQLMYVCVLPYVGTEAALEELTMPRPDPPAPDPDESTASDGREKPAEA